MSRWVIAVLIMTGSLFFCQLSRAQEESGPVGRFAVKNLKVKSFYINEQGELTRWVDDELVKVDTATGRVWKWVSERSKDKKELKEYWEELMNDTSPMSEGGR